MAGPARRDTRQYPGDVYSHRITVTDGTDPVDLTDRDWTYEIVDATYGTTMVTATDADYLNVDDAATGVLLLVLPETIEAVDPEDPPVWSPLPLGRYRWRLLGDGGDNTDRITLLTGFHDVVLDGENPGGGNGDASAVIWSTDDTTVSIESWTGEPGPQGDPGEGVPAGGTTGQILAKASGTSYDTEWIDAASTSPVFVYEPSGVAAGNVYTAWADLMTAVGAIEGPKVIQVLEAVTIPTAGMPVGGWDLNGATLSGTGNEVEGTLITFPDGCKIQNPGVLIAINEAYLYSTSTTPVLTLASATTVRLLDGAAVLSKTAEFIRVTATSGNVRVVLDQASILLPSQTVTFGIEAAGDYEAINVTGALDVFVVTDGAPAGLCDDTIRGGASAGSMLYACTHASVGSGDNAQGYTQTNATGWTVATLTQSERVAFDGDGSGESIFAGIENVNDALIELAGAGTDTSLPIMGRVVGGYYGPNGSSRSTATNNATAAGRLLLLPVWLHAGDLDRIIAYTTVAAVSTWRLGIYPSNATTQRPDGEAVLLDAGTLNMNATAGEQAITISATIPANGVYWLAVLVDSYTATPTASAISGDGSVSAGSPVQPFLGAEMASSRFQAAGRWASGVTTGSLPATCPTTTAIATVPLITVRAS